MYIVCQNYIIKFHLLSGLENVIKMYILMMLMFHDAESSATRDTCIGYRKNAD